MVDRTTLEAVFLDHNYCAPINFSNDITTSKPKATSDMADNGETLSWEEEIGIQFEPPSLENPIPSSSLSPSHSVDSGLDNEMNLFPDFNLDDYLGNFPEDKDLNGLGFLFGEEDINANTTNQLPKTQPMKKIPPTSTSTSTTTYPRRSTTVKKEIVNPIDEKERNMKNAIAARENRQKKKKHVESIEKEIKELRKDNEALKAKERNHSQTVEKLESEVTYLRNVIANQSTISALVKNLVNTPGINFTSSLVSLNCEEKSTPAEVDDDDDRQRVIRGKKTSSSSVAQEAEQEPTMDDEDKRYMTRGRKRSSVATSPSCSTKKPRKDVKGGVQTIKLRQMTDDGHIEQDEEKLGKASLALKWYDILLVEAKQMSSNQPQLL